MSNLTFAQAQSERRSFVAPAIIVVLIVAIAFAGIYFFTPHRIADLTVTHTAILPTHTVFKAPSGGTKVVGAQDDSQDVLYVLTTVRIDDRLKLPIFIDDITGTLTAADDTVTGSSAIEKHEFDNLYTTFPALKPLASAPLYRDTEIQPGEHAEGMVLLHFSVDQPTWDQRKSASVTIVLRNQGPLTVDIPK